MHKQFNTKEMSRNSFNGNNNNDHNMNGLTEIPYFERQESDDFVALQDARRIIDVLHHRVRSLENINIDLEYRLEQQAKQTMQAEHEYTEIDRSWKVKFGEMQKEAEDWAKKYEVQTLKTEKLREHLNRTERELYGMLQRKYQLMRGGPHGGGGGEMLKAGAGGGGQSQPGQKPGEGGNRSNSGNSSSSSKSQPSPSPHQPNSTPLSSSSAAPPPVEDLSEVYRRLAPEQKERRFLLDMGDFFGT